MMENEIVMASAGSGKTYRLSNRIISLLMRGVSSARVIALTFTKKAAGEFAEAVFEKLAKAAATDEAARRLSVDLGAEYTSTEYRSVLRTLVEQLPSLYLGTLDSFFTRMVQAFQPEFGLSGRGIQLLDGAEAEQLREEVGGEILLQSGETSEQLVREFLQAFKTANYGKEDVPVRRRLDDFIQDWHSVLLEQNHLGQWGRSELLTGGRPLIPWREKKERIVEQWEAVVAELNSSDKRQVTAFDQFSDQLEAYVGGSGMITGNKGMFAKLLSEREAFLTGQATSIQYYKPVEISAHHSRIIGEVMQALADEELRVYAARSEALWIVLCHYEAYYHELARRSGKVTFGDIKYLISRNTISEERRVTRELIDYRLDSRFDHWLLDEFQDTSLAQWSGLEPLIDEVAHDEERSVFVVGDVKQSIYQWRGGCTELFAMIQERYGMSVQSMQTSWRSQSPVLELVNSICGNREVMRECFGAVADRWIWNDHIKAEGLGTCAAYAEVRMVEDDEETMQWLTECLAEMQPVARSLSCAILVRGNKDVERYAESLRQLGYPVAEEGKVQPARDNALGIVILDLLRWLDDPTDELARQHIAMSPLGQQHQIDTEFWQHAHAELSLKGITSWLTECFASFQFSPFTQSRFELILRHLGDLSARGKTDLSSLLKSLETYELKVPEGSAVIEVMNIHQSKGLGFDVVILPELSGSQLVNRRHFEKAIIQEDGAGSSLLLPPASWAASFFPQLNECYDEWESQQLYESFCLLYVALTRAKRALYCVLNAEQSRKKHHLMSFASWVKKSISGHQSASQDDEQILFSTGNVTWYETEFISQQDDESAREDRTTTPTKASIEDESTITLPTRRVRRRASHSSQKTRLNRDTMARGTDLHEQLQKVGWLAKDERPRFEGENTEVLCNLFEQPEIASLFQKPANGAVELYREQPIEYFTTNGEWSSVVLDRLWTIEIDGIKTAYLLDYKSDRNRSGDELLASYREQLVEYEGAVRSVFGNEVTIVSMILSIELQEVFYLR